MVEAFHPPFSTCWVVLPLYRRSAEQKSEVTQPGND